jgi:hypothetical protein
VDPDERAATARLIDHQLAEIRSRRTVSLVVQIAFILLFASMAVVASAWWWAAAAASVGLLALTLTTGPAGAAGSAAPGPAKPGGALGAA